MAMDRGVSTRLVCKRLENAFERVLAVVTVVVLLGGVLLTVTLPVAQRTEFALEQTCTVAHAAHFTWRNVGFGIIRFFRT